ncbi:ABC transporter substrate-binding protein [Azohydromonas caseinilytica]|uniref:Putrescine-binding periplasmic protein n=1 Tax=Azohydromonas caseinilytica TaxID=2728836 RepID=A0A848FE88_9BURK|nr:spermidine/putrescine ABC transporter substrate-binding protein [Azohydromonas caseinilytica]NML17125.1 spermidine/putrescine ABC transporter substrate-binding protein [Azohydromonas caseinilytica]
MRWLRTLLLLILLPGCAAAAPDELHLFNWNNSLSAETLQRFEARCGCKVVPSYYGSMEEALAKLTAGATGFDVIGPSNYGIVPLVKLDLLQPLDKARLPHLGNLDPRYADTPADPGNRYSVPYDFTVTLLGYNEDRLKALGIDPGSWRAVFDPALLQRLKGHVTVLDDPREVIAAALRYHGHSANSRDPQALAQVAATLRAARPYWAAFNSQSYIKELTVGNIWLALGYSNDFYQARMDAQAARRPFRVGYGLQREGNGMTLDSFVIHKRAPRPDLAHRFIDFMLEGPNAAEITNLIGAGNPNRAAREHIRPELLQVPAINPGAQDTARLEQLDDLDAPTRRAWNRLWTELKAGQ